MSPKGEPAKSAISISTVIARLSFVRRTPRKYPRPNRVPYGHQVSYLSVANTRRYRKCDGITLGPIIRCILLSMGSLSTLGNNVRAPLRDFPPASPT